MHKAQSAFELLIQQYDTPAREPVADRENPLSALIDVIIAQNTSRPNRIKALANLHHRFPDLTLIAEANVVDVSDAIYVAGLANTKAPRLKAMLIAVLEATNGTADLTFLYNLPTDEAFQFLASLPGIGAMSAGLILLFTMGRPVLPVNTGLHRVAQRVGMIPPNVKPDRAQWVLQAALPSETFYAFHINMVRHARETCRAARPACERCCIAPICNWLNRDGEAGMTT